MFHMRETSARLDGLFMKTEVEDIEMLQRAILGEARDDSEQIKAEAKEKPTVLPRTGRPTETDRRNERGRLLRKKNRTRSLRKYSR